jgi:hypothetical protein
MMAAAQPRELLDFFASLNDELFNLHVKLSLRGQKHGQNANRDDVIYHWRIVDGKSRLLPNRLWRLVGEGHYSLYDPPSLQGMDEIAAFANSVISANGRQ